MLTQSLTKSFGLLVVLALVAGLTRNTSAQTPTGLASVQTRAERTNYEETSTYDDVREFLEAVAAESPRIRLTTFGTTFEGRPMPLVVVGDVNGTGPADVLATGKTRVFIQANIHAGEVCGKEAMLMFLRDVALGRHDALFDSLVLLIAPIYNADGNERVSVTNRRRQHGPIRGMGQRPNAQGYDLNRDHIKLDSPEANALVRLMSQYDPHVGVDLHTTNGTRHAYHVTYAPPLHPNTDSRILAFLKNEWLPHADDYLLEKSGWESHDYGTASPARGNREAGWYTFDHRPRFNNNYLGLRNRFAILSEAYSYATFEERVLATQYFVEGILEFSHSHAGEIRAIVAEVDADAVTGDVLGLRVVRKRSDEPVEILMGEVDEETNPLSGEVMLRRRDVKRPERMYQFIEFEAAEATRVPVAYFVPSNATGVIRKLAAHGVQYQTLARPIRLSVQVFRIDSTSVAEREFQQHNERTLFGAYRMASREIPAGTVVVRTDQPLGRLVFTLLEPRSDDGLLNWNVLDRLLEGAEEYPILSTFGTLRAF
ncbi:MAG: M14 family metallopeptidase [Gemmatimonadetes bacterium]|nr:M14 family metallopeptidase [Gemmatimonadota bacterium]